MNKSLFLHPLVNFPDSIIVDATQDKVYTYNDFYELFQPVALQLRNSGLPVNSVIVIYGLKNAFDTLKLFLRCTSSNCRHLSQSFLLPPF